MLGFSSPSRRLNSKPLVKAWITRPLPSPHLSHCRAPSPTLSNVSYSSLPPPRKGMCPNPHPAPIRALVHLQPMSKRVIRPLFSQPISRSAGILWNLSSPWVIRQTWPHDRCWLSLFIRKLSCCTSNISHLNKLIFLFNSPWRKILLSNPHAQTTTRVTMYFSVWNWNA